jgi:hypothetical protein
VTPFPDQEAWLPLARSADGSVYRLVIRLVFLGMCLYEIDGHF